MAENGKGILFNNDKKRGSQPDFTGNIDLTVDLLKEFLAEAQKNEDKTYRARLAAWNKAGKKGKFMSLSLNAPFDKPRSTSSEEGPF